MEAKKVLKRWIPKEKEMKYLELKLGRGGKMPLWDELQKSTW